MIYRNVLKRLNHIYNEIPAQEISENKKIVIFSDLHLGNGSYRDDFVHNGDLFLYILTHYYYSKQFHLILNGDIEELYKFSLRDIFSRWRDFYNLLIQFHQQNDFTQLLGNHDYQLPFRRKMYTKRNLNSEEQLFLKNPLKETLKLKWKENEIMIFHGHQGGYFNEFFHSIITFFIRHFASRLGIKNYSVAFNSKKKYNVEKRVYDFARRKKLLAIIGHTHRPLFESLSREDTLKFKIESLCRVYPFADTQERKDLEKKIIHFKDELQNISNKKTGKDDIILHTIYDETLMVPCIFNSGCGIGKNGITAIEIYQGKIRLVYWFDSDRSQKYFNYNGYKPCQLDSSKYYRVTLKEESLDYVFTRIKLLA